MASVINTNMASLISQRNLTKAQDAVGISVERLSSGLRVNRAKDDAAGISIAANLNAQVRGINVGIRNAQDAISMLQTGEGALDEVSNILGRMRDLSVQAANDSLNDNQRTSIYNEMDSLRSEINAIADRTSFNGRSLLKASVNTDALAVTAGATGTGGDVAVGWSDGVFGVTVSDIKLSATAAAGAYTFTAGTNPDQLTLSDGTDSQTITLNNLNTTQTLDFSLFGIKLTIQNGTSGTVNADDVVTAFDASALTVSSTGANSATASFQVGSSTDDTIAIDAFGDFTMAGANFGALDTAIDTFNSTKSLANAQGITAALNDAIQTLSDARGTFGAYQNRLDAAINNLRSTSENLTASRGRIMDTDYAAETSTLTKTQILQQAATAMVAQSNQMPNLVLTLLK